MWVLKCVFTAKGNIGHTGHKLCRERSEVRAQLHSSRVVTSVEFGQEVGGTRLLGLVEIAHHVGLLLPDVDRFLELHLPLRITQRTERQQQCYSTSSRTKRLQVNGRFYLNDQHVDHARVRDVLVFVEHLLHFVSSLTCCDVQLKQ